MVMGTCFRGGEDCAHLMPFTTYCRSMSPVGSGMPCSMWRRSAEMYSLMVKCLTEEERLTQKYRKVRDEAGMGARWC